jgi:NADPH:quinone reductase-like Zn-dependent oxidoreductase
VKAIVQERYGANALELRDVDTPAIGNDGVLVRVHASSVNPADWHFIIGRPLVARAMTGIRRPKQSVPGTDVAGVVEAVGKDVTEFRVGDEVMGARDGAFAELVAGRERNFVAKPPNLTFEEAAAIPVAATTALQGLRDKGELKAGQRVLILGAGGGVGSFAVQIAKAHGAQVIATTRTDYVDTVRSIGADEVIDYNREDVLRSDRRFDLVADAGGYASVGAVSRVLRPGGTAVFIGAGNADIASVIRGLATTAIRSRVRGERLRSFLAHIRKDDLVALAQLAAAGKLRPVIDRTVALADIQDAVRYTMTGRVRGKVVISVSR